MSPKYGKYFFFPGQQGGDVPSPFGAEWGGPDPSPLAETLKCSFIPVRPTSALELHISMCQRATQDLALQRGHEYAFESPVL